MPFAEPDTLKCPPSSSPSNMSLIVVISACCVSFSNNMQPNKAIEKKWFGPRPTFIISLTGWFPIFIVWSGEPKLILQAAPTMDPVMCTCEILSPAAKAHFASIDICMMVSRITGLKLLEIIRFKDSFPVYPVEKTCDKIAAG